VQLEHGSALRLTSDRPGAHLSLCARSQLL